ncbi:MAG: Gfo/Idh/MocA family oxidoreductase, partial [Verrucomicrobiota bacterium]
VALLEGFAYQHHPNHTIVREVIDRGEIGDIIQFQASFGFPPIDSAHRYDPALGGGALLDAGTYTVHAARNMLNAEPIGFSSILQSGEEQVDIHGSALLNFGSTKSATLTFGFNNMYQNWYSVWGTKGLIHLDRPFSAPPEFEARLRIEKQGITEEQLLPPANQFSLQVEEFCAGIENSSIWPSWRNDARKQAECLERIREAASV